MTIGRIAIVGGAMRDARLNEIHDLDLPIKDVDLAIEAVSLDEMQTWIETEGCEVFKHGDGRTFGTIKAKVPKSHWLAAHANVADFQWCREDGPTLNGRHPEHTTPATLELDQARRDFTVNAMAKVTQTGQIIDNWGGAADCETRTLRFVGDPMMRVEEDALRALRGLRFMVTRGLTPTDETWKAINSDVAAVLIGSPVVSTERICEELVKMFKADWWRTTQLLMFDINPDLRNALFPKDGKIRLDVSMKAK